MGSIGSVTKNNTPCELFSGTIMGQMEELEGHICDILGTEAVSHTKANISAVQATRGKGVNKIQLSNIRFISEELVSKAIDKSTQLCNRHSEKSLSRKLSTNNRMLQYRRINSVFFTDTLLAHKTPSTR